MFERAERLGMTVHELCARMTYAELVEWMALDSIRSWEAEKAHREASKGMKRR